MHQHHDDHGHRDPTVTEQPLDAANQSLADALRSSFTILKGIMLVLVVLYLFSNVRRIQPHEQALVFRLGNLLPRVEQPGLVWAFPYPIDEVVPLPTNKSNEARIDSHSFHRRKGEETKALNEISRGANDGLNPVLDGALLTSDGGLVHTRWKVTYKIGNVRDFVSDFVGDGTESAEELIRILVETIGIHVASEMKADEVVRTRLSEVQSEMFHRINERLRALNSGIEVASVEMFEPTPPLQIRQAFEKTLRYENLKKKKIDEAEQERNKILNRAAGSVHKELLSKIDAIEVAERNGESTTQLRAELDDMLSQRTEGRAGQLIREASSYHEVVVGGMQSDVELYRTLVPEYERNPHLLIARLWDQTRQSIFNNPGVKKIYKPAGTEIRLEIPLDPESARIEEELKLRNQSPDMSKLRGQPKAVIVPTGH